MLNTMMENENTSFANISIPFSFRSLSPSFPFRSFSIIVLNMIKLLVNEVNTFKPVNKQLKYTY